MFENRGFLESRYEKLHCCPVRVFRDMRKLIPRNGEMRSVRTLKDRGRYDIVFYLDVIISSLTERQCTKTR